MVTEKINYKNIIPYSKNNKIHTKQQIDISDLLSGVYFVKVVNEKEVVVGKFVKE